MSSVDGRSGLRFRALRGGVTRAPAVAVLVLLSGRLLGTGCKSGGARPDASGSGAAGGAAAGGSRGSGGDGVPGTGGKAGTGGSSSDASMLDAPKGTGGSSSDASVLDAPK